MATQRAPWTRKLPIYLFSVSLSLSLLLFVSLDSLIFTKSWKEKVLRVFSEPWRKEGSKVTAIERCSKSVPSRTDPRASRTLTGQGRRGRDGSGVHTSEILNSEEMSCFTTAELYSGLQACFISRRFCVFLSCFWWACYMAASRVSSPGPL